MKEVCAFLKTLAEIKRLYLPPNQKMNSKESGATHSDSETENQDNRSAGWEPISTQAIAKDFNFSNTTLDLTQKRETLSKRFINNVAALLNVQELHATGLGAKSIANQPLFWVLKEALDTEDQLTPAEYTFYLEGEISTLAEKIKESPLSASQGIPGLGTFAMERLEQLQQQKELCERINKFFSQLYLRGTEPPPHVQLILNKLKELKPSVPIPKGTLLLATIVTLTGGALITDAELNVLDLHLTETDLQVIGASIAFLGLLIFYQAYKDFKQARAEMESKLTGTVPTSDSLATNEDKNGSAINAENWSTKDKLLLAGAILGIAFSALLITDALTATVNTGLSDVGLYGMAGVILIAIVVIALDKYLSGSQEKLSNTEEIDDLSRVLEDPQVSYAPAYNANPI